MMVETNALFASLLPTLRIGVVCDVGSMDGADALRFRAAVPGSTVYAFEPNPSNFRAMEGNETLKQSHIHLERWAVTNYDGEAEFFVVNKDPWQNDGSRAMGSLYKRSDPWPPLVAVVPVKTTRLDTFFADRLAPSDRLALWIDTEGKGYEVIEGVIGIADQVHLVHVEVEDKPYIASNQRIYSEVKMLLTRLGFVELATDQTAGAKRNAQGDREDQRGSKPWLAQFNALYVRCDLPLWMRCHVRANLFYAWFRSAVIRALRTWCPGCLRRYQKMREGSLESRKRPTT